MIDKFRVCLLTKDIERCERRKKREKKICLIVIGNQSNQGDRINKLANVRVTPVEMINKLGGECKEGWVNRSPDQN